MSKTKRTMKVEIFGEKLTPWHAFDAEHSPDLTGYQIRMVNTELGCAQRHEWTKRDGSKDIEKWITVDRPAFERFQGEVIYG